jgi:hypothetical protein
LPTVARASSSVSTLGRPARCRALRVAAPCGCCQAGHVDLTEKLQLKPGQSLAILNPPPGVTLPTSTAGSQPATASAVIGFAVHRDDLDHLGTVIGAARADRP